MIEAYFGPRRVVFAFLADDSLFTSDFRLLFAGVDGVVESTLKNPSKRPCVDVVRVFWIFLQPARMRSSLNWRSPHMNWTMASSSGSVHFNYNNKNNKDMVNYPGKSEIFASNLSIWHLLQRSLDQLQLAQRIAAVLFHNSKVLVQYTSWYQYSSIFLQWICVE